MVRADLFKWASIPVIAGVALMALSGCSGSSSAAPATATLASTKPQVQLLRNEAASRLDQDGMQDVTVTKDGSVACKAPDVDPKGLFRAWNSTITFNVLPKQAQRVDAIGQSVVNSFVKQQWDASVQKGENSSTTLLQKSGTSIDLRVGVEKDASSNGKKATVSIQTTGACVETGGADSEEVKKLEAAESK